MHPSPEDFRTAGLAADPHGARLALSEIALQEMELLASLPVPVKRDCDQRAVAAAVHSRARSARMAFMEQHGAWLYDELTDRRTVSLRLADLVQRAALQVPHLFATPEQWAEESGRTQAEREGWEIEQGIFAWGLLRVPECGVHLVEAMLRPLQRSLDLVDSFRSRGYVEAGPVCIERKGDAAYLTVCNDRDLNAEDNELAEAMETCIDLALLDDQVRVGVLRGGVMSHPKYRGQRVFCAGINLKHLCGGRISFVDFLLGRELGYVNKVRRGLRGAACARRLGSAITEKPWIAAVDTFAIGGGFQLLLVFDHVIASRGAYFVLPAAKEGIIPGLANLRLASRAGSRVARDMILRGRTLQADEPDAAAFVDRVVEQPEMEGAIEEAKAMMRCRAIPANRRMMHVADEPLDHFRAYMADFALEQVERIYAPDVLARLGARYA